MPQASFPPRTPCQGGRLGSCLSEPCAESPASTLWETLWPSRGVLGAPSAPVTMPARFPSLFLPSGRLVRAALWLGGFFRKLEERDGSDKPYLVSSAVVGSVTAPVPSLVQGIRSPQHINSLVGRWKRGHPCWEKGFACILRA